MYKYGSSPIELFPVELQQELPASFGSMSRLAICMSLTPKPKHPFTKNDVFETLDGAVSKQQIHYAVTALIVDEMLIKGERDYYQKSAPFLYTVSSHWLWPVYDEVRTQLTELGYEFPSIEIGP